MAGGGGVEGDPEFQIAPMIDVLLVLLIFFMSIATTAVSRYDPTIELPVAPDANLKDDSAGELVFNISWQAPTRTAVTTYEEHAVTVADVLPSLIAHKTANPQVRVLIRSDALTPVRHVSAVVEVAAKAGISDVTFATLDR